MLKHKLFSIIALFLQVFALVKQNAAFSAVVTPYSNAIKVGVIDDQINVMYDKEIYWNKQQFAKLLSLVDNPKIPTIKLDSYVFKGFDQKVVKTMIALNGDFTTGSAGSEVTLTLVQDDKYHVTENQILKFSYTPSAGYTNEVYVSDRMDATNRTEIKVKPVDATLCVGKSVGYTGYNTNDPTINCLGTFFDDNSASAKSVTTNPEVIYNYVQLQKSSYEYGKMAAEQNLYTAGTLKNAKDSMTKALHLKLMQKTMLFGGTRYRSGIALPTSVTEYQKMWGLEDWILTNGTANKGYTSTIATGLIDDFHEWLWLMADPDLGGPAKVRLAACNNAAIKWLTDVVANTPNLQLTDVTSYGLPGIKRVNWGHMSLDLMVESAINERYSTQDKPYIMAVTPSMIKVAKLEPTTLYANIQNNDVHGYKSEYRTAWTFLLHNSATAYHGIFYDAS